MTKQKRDAKGRFLPVIKKVHECKCKRSGCKARKVVSRIPEPTTTPTDITDSVDPEIVARFSSGLYALADAIGLTANPDPVTIELVLTAGNRQITISDQIR